MEGNNGNKWEIEKVPAVESTASWSPCSLLLCLELSTSTHYSSNQTRPETVHTAFCRGWSRGNLGHWGKCSWDALLLASCTSPGCYSTQLHHTEPSSALQGKPPGCSFQHRQGSLWTLETTKPKQSNKANPANTLIHLPLRTNQFQNQPASGRNADGNVQPCCMHHPRNERRS